ncbi:unnamed protein product [Durusdinium trenchii]|uniref:Xrn1 N-terminal domain-containing protein n=1 Tax=Durusdinium trenchii TaxID=1381693 RepID=A0ABP0LBK9_9DINO
MGIPRLTPWLRNTFPDAFRNEAQLKAEHVYIDLNSVLHETLSARGGSASEEVHLLQPVKPCRHEVFLQAVLARVDHLLDRVTPSQTLFVAIDGPACAAKVPEQRRRRRARPPRARELGVTLNMLTPGVPVMDHLAAVLREHLKRLQAEGQLPGNLQVMVSGPDDAGEGEHKIMLQLVMNESLKSGEDEKHVIVGTDSDLLLVPLALLHGPRAVWVARCEEAVTTASGQLTTLRVCQTEQVVQSLLRQFINLATPTGSLTPKDELHLRLDFLLVTCLRGNDYLPQLASDHDSSELWPRYLRWRQRSQLGLVDLERADADEQICPVLMGVPFADFLSQQGGAWSPQKVTGLSAKEGAQQYLEALLWCLDTYVTGRCPDLHRCWSSSQLGHFAFAALIAQQIPLLEPSCFKAARRDTPPLSPLACALAVLPVTDVRRWLLPLEPCLAPLLETSGLLGEVARLEACGDCSRLSLLVANGPSNGKKAEKNRRALEVHRREHRDIDAVSLEDLNEEVQRLRRSAAPPVQPMEVEAKPKRVKRRRR